MYATRDDMVKRFGEREVIALTDRAYSGAIDDDVLVGGLDAATTEIDGYLSSRYPAPFAVVPKILVGYACDIARYRLVGAGTQDTQEIRDRYRDAVRFLEFAAAGKVTLGGLPNGEPVKTENTVQFASGTRVFARDKGAY